MYVKRNFFLQVVVEEKFVFVGDKYILKKEIKWNYQIQGLMGIIGIYCCDLVIYIFKGILIVNVKFDSELWNEMFEKLRNVFLKYIVQEFFYYDIFKLL